MFSHLGKSRFFKLWLAVFALAIIFTSLYLFLLKRPGPSLQEVLSQHELQNTINGSFFLAGVFVLALLGLSAAKSYELVSRGQALAEIVLPEEKIDLCDLAEGREVEILRKGLKELRETIVHLGKGQEELQHQNVQLETEIDNLMAKNEAADRVETMLRKSNIVLGKEAEKLKSQNEELVLKINALGLKDKIVASKRRVNKEPAQVAKSSRLKTKKKKK